MNNIKFKIKDLEAAEFFFVYFNPTERISAGTYTHPELRVYKRSKDYPSCHDPLFSFVWQTDTKNTVPYAMRINIEPGHYQRTALKVITRFLTSEYNSDGFRAIVRKLNKFNFRREVYTDKYRFVPWKFRAHADDYLTAQKLISTK